MRTPGRRPVTPESLMRIATFYLAQHAASSDRLREVLARKIARRMGMDAELPDPTTLDALIDPVVERLQQAGLLDDAAFARGRAASLAAKGRPAWRIKAELEQAGVAAPDDLLADLDPAAQARVLARRKRLGPYRAGDREPFRDRDVAALNRAGFPVAVAIAVVDGAAD